LIKNQEWKETMRTSIRKRLALAAALTGALSLTAAGAAVAGDPGMHHGAAVASGPDMHYESYLLPAPSPKNSTPGCITLWSSQCVTPVVAVAALGSEDLTPADDFAMTYQGPNPIMGQAYGDLGSNFNNDLGNVGGEHGVQDFAWDQIATVPHVGGSAGAYKFTGFDRHNFGGDPVFELEYVPGGLDTGLCVTVSSRTRSNGVVLGGCQSDIRQAFIVTQHAPFLSTPPGSYWYAFNAAQAANSQHHNALLDPHPDTDDSLLAVGNAPHVGAGLASLALWSSIP
jgi:hypothetical protein